MEAHLGIAQSHTNCGQDVRGQEETEIVSLNIFYENNDEKLIYM